MAQEFTFELSKIPPSTNALWRVASGGRGYKSARYATWSASAQLELMAQRLPAVAGPYALHVRFARPDRRARDLDNLIKPVSDLLVTMRVIESDHLAQRITAEWSSAGPAVWGQIISTRAAK